MSFEGMGVGALDYAPCRYDGSQINFRGPERRLDAPYVAFFGGSETYGKYVKSPFPALVESELGVNCINFGVMNAGIDVFLGDKRLLEIAAAAELTVLQVMGATNMSNRFYTVHPRRNDRFITASDKLKVVYPEVDFAEFHFIKHMLNTLYEVSPERFEIVVAEIQMAWTARMKTLLGRIDGKTVLVWFADRHAPTKSEVLFDPVLARDPLFVTSDMIEDLRPELYEYIEVAASKDALSAGIKGMVFPEVEEPAAREMLGPKAHAEVAVRLRGILQGLV